MLFRLMLFRKTARKIFNDGSSESKTEKDENFILDFLYIFTSAGL